MKRKKKFSIGALIDKIIYYTTKKPTHYQRVKKPPFGLNKLLHPKKARQQQYNNWSKKHKVYSGSYLPQNPNTLLRQGWKEITSSKNKTNMQRDFQRKSTKQLVRHDKETSKKGKHIDAHYHWYNATSIAERRKVPNEKKYFNKYGKSCAKGSPESHLAPNDEDYKYRR